MIGMVGAFTDELLDQMCVLDACSCDSSTTDLKAAATTATSYKSQAESYYDGAKIAKGRMVQYLSTLQ